MKTENENMDDSRGELMGRLAELVLKWGNTAAYLACPPSRTEGIAGIASGTIEVPSEYVDWAFRVTGEEPARWAFEELNKTLATEELDSAFRIVAHWTLAGMLYSTLHELADGTQLAEGFATYLHEAGYVPFVSPAPEEP